MVEAKYKSLKVSPKAHKIIKSHLGFGGCKSVDDVVLKFIPKRIQ